MKSPSRRELLTYTAVGIGSATLISTIAADVGSAAESSRLKLSKGDTVLFQGDSITDCHRDKHRKTVNDSRAMGVGYPLRIGGDLLLNHPTLDLKFYNRGISGNRVPSLQKRWDKDCIALKPSVLSILVGVNDFWHKIDGKYDGTTETYRVGFTELLASTKRQLPETKIVICEPFALRVGAVKDTWYPEFDDRRKVAREVCDAAGAIWVPFQTMFDQAIAAGPAAAFWAADGVHPSMTGHALMAKTWQEVVLGGA